MSAHRPSRNAGNQRLTLRRPWAYTLAAVLVLAVLGTPNGTAGAEDRPAFVNGDGKAFANVFDLKIQIAGNVGSDQGLAIGFGSGRAITQYQDSASSAEGRALDYALSDLLNMQPTPECPNVIPLFLDSTKPPVTRAESTTAGQDVSQLTPVKYAGFPTYGPDFGAQDATAAPGPTASALTTAPLVDAGLVKLVNPRSESTSRVVNGVRESIATSSADSLSVMGGAMTLFRPKWTATAKSGATTVASADFTYSSAMILGITRPGGRTDDLNAFKGFVENTFSGLGLKLVLPKAKITPGSNGTGSVEISPLVVGLENIPLGSALLSPVLRAISPQIDAAVAAYLAQDCSNPALQLIADVARGILSGKGGLSFALGGVSAMTDDVYYPPVNFDIGSSAATDTPAAPSIDTGGSGFVSDPTTGFTTPTTEFTPTTEPGTDVLGESTVPPPMTTTSEPKSSDGTDERADGPNNNGTLAAQHSTGGTTGGTAGWLTIVGLAGVLALAAGDHFVMRRSRRRFSA